MLLPAGEELRLRYSPLGVEGLLQLSVMPPGACHVVFDRDGTELAAVSEEPAGTVEVSIGNWTVHRSINGCENSIGPESYPVSRPSHRAYRTPNIVA